MKSYNYMPYEKLVYYSINTILRKKGSTFDYDTLLNTTIPNNYLTESNQLYKNAITGGVNRDIFDLGYNVGIGKNNTFTPIFKLNTVIANANYTLKLNGKSYPISVARNSLTTSYYTFTFDTTFNPLTTYISSKQGKIYNGNNQVAYIVEQNDIQNGIPHNPTNYNTYSYQELYQVYSSDYSSTSNNPMTTWVSFYNFNAPLSTSNPVNPLYKTVSNNILDIHNFIMQSYYRWGYYSGLNEKISCELLTVNRLNDKFYLEDKINGEIIFNPNIKLYKDGIYDFTNYLIYKFQETKYLAEKYKRDYEKYKYYWDMGIADAIVGKTNYEILKSNSEVNPNYYRIINETSNPMNGDTFLNELMAIEGFNRLWILKYISRINSTYTHDTWNVFRDTILGLESDSTADYTNHFDIYNDTFSLPILSDFDTRNYTFLWGLDTTSKLNMSKYDLMRRSADTYRIRYALNDNTLYDTSDVTNWSYFSSETDNNNIVMSIRRMLFKRYYSDFTSSSIISGMFTATGGYYSFIESKTGYSGTWSYIQALKVWNIIEYYIKQVTLFDDNETDYMFDNHYQDEWNLKELFTGYILSIDDNGVISPASETIDFILKFKKYLKLTPSNKIIDIMCHYILFTFGETNSNTFDTTEVKSFMSQAIDNNLNIKQIVSLNTNDISSVIQNITEE